MDLKFDFESDDKSSSASTLSSTVSSPRSFYCRGCGCSLDHDKVSSTTTMDRLFTNSDRQLAKRLHPTREARPGRLRGWMSATIVLIGATSLANMAAFSTMVGRSRLTQEACLNGVATNILAAVLIRQEFLLNTMFRIITSVPPTAPLIFRKRLADFHHFGGLHVGCALSSLLWYGAYVVLRTLNIAHSIRHGTTPRNALVYVDAVTCCLFIVFLLVICITAVPRCRTRFHNTFERSHRFAGWISVAVFWVHAGVTSVSMTPATPLYKHASIYLLIVITLLLIRPWLLLRRVVITSARPVSSRGVALTFPYLNMPPISTARFSTNPLVEWHSFATIPSKDGREASIIIADAGDWTRDIIQNPPKYLWFRKPPTYNFLLTTHMFNSMVIVATGAGIGPCLSLLASYTDEQLAGKTIKVVWCARDPQAEHWAFARDIIHSVDAEPEIIDTDKGRPDLLLVTEHMVRSLKLEAVFVVSNQKLTENVVFGMKSIGCPAYGATFDS